MKKVIFNLKDTNDDFGLDLGREGDDLFLRCSSESNVDLFYDWVPLTSRTQIVEFARWWGSSIVDVREGFRSLEFIAIATSFLASKEKRDLGDVRPDAYNVL